MRRFSKKGSALVGVIWLLAVLSILIASYAVDAHLQTRINIYLRERVAVDHLTDAGVAIAEVILTDFQNVSEASSDADLEEFLDKDRWYLEKQKLKEYSESPRRQNSNGDVSTGAVPIDALNPDGGTVTVTIRPIESKFNLNNLYAGGDANFADIWMGILAVSGIPKDYWDGIVNGWCDWRDTDGTKTGDDGAESDFYSEAYQDFVDGRDVEKNKNYKPKARDGEVVDIEELKAIKGFNEYEEKPINPDAILNGGVLNPDEDEKNQIFITNGISAFFSLYGSGKINVNAVKDPRILAVIPGIFQGNPDDERQDDVEEALAIANEIIRLRDAAPPEGTNPLLSSDNDNNEYGAYKDFSAIQDRLQSSGLDIQNEASAYLAFQPEKFFEVVIVGQSFGIVHKIVATVLVTDGKVRYLRWQEDP